ncbi:MAG: type II toxin-antitoxin system VapC family toxin, partial [Dictyoglomi bacterium]|nr:type II toxin-antitoxin system VapC family toxin [Dictyoglomota bacterium]
MNLSEEISKVRSIFIDTAPIIYYIEAHPLFGSLTKTVVDIVRSSNFSVFTSVITLVEVLSKPIQMGREDLAREFKEFLRGGKDLTLIEISVDIAERAGNLRGKYPSLKALDAIQLATAFEIEADAFLTNDEKLKKIEGLK